jgi:FkbM family methyltransferase
MKEQLKNFINAHRNSGVLGNLLAASFDYANSVRSHGFNFSKYQSEHGQDKFVDSHLKRKRKGFFVEVGAHTGIEKSNTYFFQSVRGWSGICIEPNPQLYPKLVANRSSKKCICLPYAIDSVPGEARFIPADFWGRLETRIDERDKLDFYQDKGQERVIVPVRTLQQVLDSEFPRVTRVDYLSVDTEGNDLNVLKGIDWNRVSWSN